MTILCMCSPILSAVRLDYRQNRTAPTLSYPIAKERKNAHYFSPAPPCPEPMLCASASPPSSPTLRPSSVELEVQDCPHTPAIRHQVPDLISILPSSRLGPQGLLLLPFPPREVLEQVLPPLSCTDSTSTERWSDSSPTRGIVR